MNLMFFRRSLAQQFLLLGFPILLGGTLFMGHWIAEQVQESVVHRMGGMTALYVDSFVSQHVQGLARSDDLTAADRTRLADMLAHTPLGAKIAGLKIWRRDGRVLYSTDASQIGKDFPIEEGLAAALHGEIFSEITERSDQHTHGQPLPRVIETYTPIHADSLGRVIAVAEFYQLPDEVDREAGAAQRRSWMTVAGTTLVMYVLLFMVVRRGSQTIAWQQRDLSAKVSELTTVNAQNAVLHQRVRRAAERATALNENFLQRLSADLHDGPGQDLGYALMRLETVSAECSGVRVAEELERNLGPVRIAVQAALADLRAISADLQLPDIQHLTVVELVARSVRDYEGKTMAKVQLECTLADDVAASTRIKITLCRVLQECLANVYRHAGGDNCRVSAHGEGETLTIEVKDSGPGFHPGHGARKGRLGLAGMRERVEIVGGTFSIQSGAGRGTTIRAVLPLWAREEAHA